MFDTPPIIFLVSSDAAVRDRLEADLARRFANDTRIVAGDDPAAGLTELRAMADAGEPVALLIADHAMAGQTGIDFLSQAHDLHPAAKRILLVERDYTAANPIVPAMMLGQIDYHLTKPWFPDHGLYPAVSEFLASWARSENARFTMFRIAAPENSRRGHEIRDLLTRFSTPFACDTPDSSAGRELLREAGQGDPDLPTVIRHDGRVLVDPSDGDLIEAVGGATELGDQLYDVAIVGAGPAGLSAAVYAASEGLETIVLERQISGGQAGASSRIRNVPGFTWGIGGHDLSYRACEQAWLFGANMVFAQQATALEPAGDRHVLRTADGQEVTARPVVLAMGVSWRRLGAERLESLIGRGVFYGATATEARAMRGGRVAVVGAGNAAGQAALDLARHAAQVTLLVRGDSLGDKMSEYLIAEIRERPNIDIRHGVEVVDGEGGDRLQGLVIESRANRSQERIAADGLFVMIGAEPHTEWLARVVQRDERGFILTGTDVQAEDGEPLLLETSVPGVFAAGDVRHGSVKRVTTAMGDGATVIQLVHRALDRAATALEVSR
jgi:thioredoxin reductase (NADPH)